MGNLKVGDPAPDFTARTGTGETISLKSLRGKQIVLYFYPKDDTPGCTIEACGFRDATTSLEQAGAVVLGISRDGQASHQTFSKKFNLPFRLLCDEDGTIERAYGAHWPILSCLPVIGRLIGSKRKTFVIDATGRLKAIFPKVDVKTHVDEVLATLCD
ncbi:MAG: peroxiredoxin [Nitrospira sp.]|nr:peroxiredoxin [Nitrospira sp.]